MKLIRYRDANLTVGYASLLPDGTAVRVAGDVFGSFEATSEVVHPAKVLAPVAPPCILAMGLNYRSAAVESNLPVPDVQILTLKATSAVQNPGDPIVLPRHLRSDQVDYGCELAVVIGRTCRNVSPSEAMDHVLGYTCANDVTARDWQLKCGGQWGRSKGFDTFAPLGPCLVLKDEIPDPKALTIRTRLNGQVMQEARCEEMIFDVPAIIAFLSGSTTLLPGTVIITGSPAGCGFARKPPVFLRPGDSVSVEIDRIGTLTNPVVAEDGRDG